jgi:peptidoglycan/LPS O-acetylase OafA/YrhL
MNTTILQNGKLTKQASNAIKGFAIIAMLIHHFLIRSYDYNTFILPTNVMHVFGLALRICIPLFVFVTGYGSYLSLKNDTNIFQWAKRRIYSIWKGYVPFAIICILLGVAVGWKAYDWHRIFEDLSGLHQTSDYHGYILSWWYMPTAYVLVLVAPFTKKLVDKYGAYIFLVSLILPLVFDFEYTGLDVLFCWLPVLIEGMLFAKVKIKPQNNFGFGILYICLGLLLFGICLVLGGYILWFRFWLTTPFFILGILNICSSIKITQLIAFLGKYSFGMYLCHTLIYDVFFEYINALSKVYWLLPVILTAGISLLATILISKLSSKIFAKIEAVF